MNAIITSCVYEKERLIGYNAWIFGYNNSMIRVYINRSNLGYFFKKYNVLNCKYISNNTVKSLIRFSLKDYPKYTKNKKLIVSGYTEAHIISATLNIDIEKVRIYICGALIAGAIYNPDSGDALQHAVLYYEEIRHMSTDIEKIAKRTGYSIDEIQRIKMYLFVEQHHLERGFVRFDESFEIAESWQRLMTDNMKIENHDLTLLKHELLEISLVISGLSQEKAHDIASMSYNYGKEAKEFYDTIKKYN